MSIPYWGRKSNKYMQRILGLFPKDEVHVVVDACMGSGSFSESISCQMEGVERLSFELDKGVYIMHKVIREQLGELLDRMMKVQFSEELYESCRAKINRVLAGDSHYEEVDIALAELILLYFSHNSMRGTHARKYDSYKKHEKKEEQERNRYTLRKIFDRFYLKAPGDIVFLHSKWQRLNIIHDDFRNHKDLWENDRAWIYIDMPYELSKRGLNESHEKMVGHYGYDVDMTVEDHEKFIQCISDMYEENRLRAKMIVCTNYEVDEFGHVIIRLGDRYSRLLNCGFRRIIIDEKACSNPYISTEQKTGAVKKKHRKVEVVYINYEIVGEKSR